jgi:peptidoglycan-associated lipoprotein
MIMHVRRIALLATSTLVVAAAACKKTPPAPAPTPTPGQRGPDQDSLRRARAEEAARQAAAEEARRKAAEDAARDAAARDAANAASVRTTLLAAVHFDFDQSDLRPDERALLDAKIPILQANSGVTIRIAGHTDERGSDEYNLALGQRRAAVVKAYLVQRGISATRVETVSYGEERPAAQGADEGAWAQNRRAEFEITAGGQTLRRP